MKNIKNKNKYKKLGGLGKNSSGSLRIYNWLIKKCYTIKL
jgi:hypothetical protein